MRLFRCYRIVPALFLLTLPAFASAHRGTALKTHRHASVKHVGTTSRKSSRVVSHTPAVAMPAERATAIQTALIKRGYLSGEPTGAWDGPTVSAMEKLQADNGWQSRITPDSRALIKLGLGPNSDPGPAHEDAVTSPR